MGNAGPLRELHHLSTAMDLLRQGNLNLLGDMLASRFMAIHQASVDGNWTAARHMELFPLEDTASATSAVLLETRRHAKLAAKVAGLDASGWSPGGRGKGYWKGKNSGVRKKSPWVERIVERKEKERKVAASNSSGGAIRRMPTSGRTARTPMQRRRPE